MKIVLGKSLLSDFTNLCDADKDSYFLIHFSKEEDKYAGYHERIDWADARIILKHLIKEFDLTEMDFKLMVNSINA